MKSCHSLAWQLCTIHSTQHSIDWYYDVAHDLAYTLPPTMLRVAVHSPRYGSMKHCCCCCCCKSNQLHVHTAIAHHWEHIGCHCLGSQCSLHTHQHNAVIIAAVAAPQPEQCPMAATTSIHHHRHCQHQCLLAITVTISGHSFDPLLAD